YVLLHARRNRKSVCGMDEGPDPSSDRSVQGDVRPRPATAEPVRELPQQPPDGELVNESERSPRAPPDPECLTGDRRACAGGTAYYDPPRHSTRGRCRQRGGTLARSPGPHVLPERMGDTDVPGSPRRRARHRPCAEPSVQVRVLNPDAAVPPDHPLLDPRCAPGGKSSRGRRRGPPPCPPRDGPRIPEHGDRDSDDPRLHARGAPARLRQDRPNQGALRNMGALQACPPQFADLDGDGPRSHRGRSSL